MTGYMRTLALSRWFLGEREKVGRIEGWRGGGVGRDERLDPDTRCRCESEVPIKPTRVDSPSLHLNKPEELGNLSRAGRPNKSAP